MPVAWELVLADFPAAMAAGLAATVMPTTVSDGEFGIRLEDNHAIESNKVLASRPKVTTRTVRKPDSTGV